MNRKGKFIQLFCYILAVLLLAGCGEVSPEQTGEIIGVSAQVPFDELQTGDIKNFAYLGTVVVLLPENEEVLAYCSEELLSKLTGLPVFNVDEDEIIGGLVVKIIINVEPPQSVLLDKNEADEWKVTKILK